MFLVNVHVNGYVLLKRNWSTLLPPLLILDSKMALRKVANKAKDFLKTVFRLGAVL